MTARVLVAGDANLDIVLRGDIVPRFGQVEQLVDALDIVLGSSAGICAAGLARLDIDVAMVSRVGSDMFGERTLALLAQSGVDTTAIRVTADPTGVSVILSAPGDRAILTRPGAFASLSAAEILSASEHAAHVHLASFFLLPALVPELPQLLRELRGRGVTTSLDTNWDPSERWTGVAECLPFLDLLLPNAAEALAIARVLGEDPADAREAAEHIARHGPTVVVKDGREGGFAVATGTFVHAPGHPIDVADTTGAGDSFDAGFLASWIEHRDVSRALRWAVAAGSLSTRASGGTGGQATRIEVERLVIR